MKISTITTRDLIEHRLTAPLTRLCMERARMHLVRAGRLKPCHTLETWARDLLETGHFLVFCIGKSMSLPPRVLACYRCYYVRVPGSDRVMLSRDDVYHDENISRELVAGLWCNEARSVHGTFLEYVQQKSCRDIDVRQL